MPDGGQDEHDDHPVGTYACNAPGSEHTQRADKGCMIFVKFGLFL